MAEGRNGSRRGVEEILGVENVVADELEQAAVKTVRSRSADHVDHRSGLASEFRSIGCLLDVEFLDGVDRWGDHHVVEVLVGDGDAIHQIQIVPAALPQNVDQVAGLLHRIAARAAGRPDDAWAQHRQIEKLAPLQGQIEHLLAPDHIPDFRGFQLHAAGVGHESSPRPSDRPPPT